MDENQFCSVYDQIKALGDKGKCITDADLKIIAVTIGVKLKRNLLSYGFSVMLGDLVSSTATLKLDIMGLSKKHLVLVLDLSMNLLMRSNHYFLILLLLN